MQHLMGENVDQSLKAAQILLDRGYGKLPDFDRTTMPNVVVLVGQGQQAVGPSPWQVIVERSIDTPEPAETWVTRPLKQAIRPSPLDDLPIGVAPEPAEDDEA